MEIWNLQGKRVSGYYIGIKFEGTVIESLPNGTGITHRIKVDPKYRNFGIDTITYSTDKESEERYKLYNTTLIVIE